MTVCTFRNRRFTTVINGTFTNTDQLFHGFKNTEVSAKGHPCVMEVEIDHERASTSVMLTEWNAEKTEVVDLYKWVFSQHALEAYTWGRGFDQQLAADPYVTIYPSVFTIAFNNNGNGIEITELMNRMDCRPALETLMHQHFPMNALKKTIVQIEYNKEGILVFSLHPVRELEEVNRAAVEDRQETTAAFFKTLLGEDNAFA